MLGSMVVHMSGKVGAPSQIGAEAGPQPTEANLLQGIVRGERWAADALYDALYPSVARSLQRVLHDPSHDYEDLVQTTFERLMRTLLEQPNTQVVSLTAWASGIAAHVALDALRKRVRERKLFRTENPDHPDALEHARAPNAEHGIEARHQLAIVRSVLSSMKADLAETVVLHDMVGHDLRETAEATGVSVAAAQSRLVRGRKELLKRVHVRLGREQG
jgi:RNA polymerase sigma-70 factor, ECF subfamily